MEILTKPFELGNVINFSLIQILFESFLDNSLAYGAGVLRVPLALRVQKEFPWWALATGVAAMP